MERGRGEERRLEERCSKEGREREEGVVGRSTSEPKVNVGEGGRTDLVARGGEGRRRRSTAAFTLRRCFPCSFLSSGTLLFAPARNTNSCLCSLAMAERRFRFILKKRAFFRTRPNPPSLSSLLCYGESWLLYPKESRDSKASPLLTDGGKQYAQILVGPSSPSIRKVSYTAYFGLAASFICRISRSGRSERRPRSNLGRYFSLRAISFPGQLHIT